MHLRSEGEAAVEHRSLAGQIDHDHVVSPLPTGEASEVEEVFSGRIAAPDHHDRRALLVVVLEEVARQCRVLEGDFDGTDRDAE